MFLFIVSLFIAFALITETIGIFFRLIGSINTQPTLGYSIHVRIATLGRIFTFFSAPALGYIVDTGNATNKISLIGFYTYLLVFLTGLWFLAKGEKFINYTYSKFTNNSNFEKIQWEKINYSLKVRNKNFYIIAAFSFLTTSIGLLIVNYFATIFVQFKATIIQTSAFVTALGTLLHVFIIDPKLAKTGDKNPDELYDLVNDFISARVVQSLLLALIFLIMFFCKI